MADAVDNPSIPPVARHARPKRRRPSRVRRALLAAGIVGGVAGAAFWFALHELPWFGPWAADAARNVVGPRVVAWAEDVV